VREILTAFAMFLIVLLTAALAAPYFVDWNGQRAFVEARLTQALGQKVTVGGNIDLKILPTPYLVLDQAVIGEDDGPLSLGIRHLDLELSVTPLLRGEFDITEARLEEPTIRLTLGRDRGVPALPKAPAFQADVRFDRVSVVDGTLAIADPASGRTFAVDHLDFDAEVDSLSGPFRGNGAAGSPDARTKFRFASSTGRFGRTRAKLVVEETLAHAGLELDGTVGFSGATKDSLRETFDGTAAVSGHVRAGDALVLPWRLSGPVHLDPARCALGEGELRVGAENRALSLSATGEAELEATPRLALTIAGKQVDVDRLFGGGVSTTGVALKPTLPTPEAVGRALDGSAPPLPITVNVAIATATLGGETLGDVKALFDLGGAGPTPVRLSGDGPGESHLAVAGTLSPAPGESFDGLFDASAGDLPALDAWLATVDPALPRLPLGFPVRAAGAKGHLALGERGIAASGLALKFGRSALTGGAGYAPPREGRPAILRADLDAQALDLDALPDLGAARAAMADIDLDLKCDARAIKVARLGDGTLDAGHIRLALTKTGPRFALNDFRLENLGGATLDATAALDPDGGSIEARIDADRLGEAAALVKRVAPGALSDAFAVRAAALSPAKVKVGARLRPLVSGGYTPTALTIAGTLGATKIDAALNPDPSDATRVVAGATLATPDGGALLRQLGAATLPLKMLGTSHVTLDARGALTGSLDASLYAALGDTILGGSGVIRLGGGNLGGTGRLKLFSPDVTPLLQSLAVAFPDFLGRVPVETAGGFIWSPSGFSVFDIAGRFAGSSASGTLTWRQAAGDEPALVGALDLDRLSLETLVGLALGPPQAKAADAAWSNQPFGSGLLDPPRARLALKAKLFEIGLGPPGRDVALTLDVARGLVGLDGFTARFGGGTAEGHVAIRRDGPNATLEGRVGLSGVGLGLPGARGALTGSLGFAGGGRSASALIASAAGTGMARIGDLHVPGADPAALSAVFDAVEGDHVSVDEESIQRAFDEAARGPLAAGDRAFMLSLAAGVLHIDANADGAGAPKPAVASTVSAAIDLRAITIDEHVEEVLHALPKDWTGPPPRVALDIAGPLDTPRVTRDIGPFINALAARALARESARIEAYEFDLRERAFFNARLQSDRAREQERLKAEEDARQAAEAARKAEAERRAREEAARLAHLAQEKAAQERAAREKAAQERDAQERAAREKAAQERDAQERAARERDREDQPALDQRRQDGSRTDPPIETHPGVDRLNQPVFQSPDTPIDPSAAGRY
jgi:hypothetical protein